MTCDEPLPTIAQAASLIRRKALSPVELTLACLRRIEHWQPRIHAFVTLTADTALAAARAAEATIMREGPRHPLHGIPLGLKDVFDVQGVPTTANSRQLAGHVARRDAAVVERLRQAGAILLGKMTTHEFAFGGPSFDLPWPPARNPWHLAHFTGGSSSGSAAGVAAGLVLGSFGSDTSGSVRSPAALCGITGLKPTYGLVSRHGCIPLAHSLDHVGPMAVNAQDCGLLLQAVAGHDPRDPASVRARHTRYDTHLNGRMPPLRIGVIRHFFEHDACISDAGIRAIDAALEVFRDQGANVRDVHLPALQEWGATGMLILLAEGYALHRHRLRSAPDCYGESMRDRISMGAFICAADYVQAGQRRRELTQALWRAMSDLDLLICATQAGEAPRIEQVPKWAAFESPSHCMPSSLSGFPALSLCVGFGSAGLPLSMQMIARPFEEPLLLRAAHLYERQTLWHRYRPLLAD